MSAVDRFIARVDETPIEVLTTREIRTRLELLEAEFEQLTHDTEHVKSECYGLEKVLHLRRIEREHSAAQDRKTRLTAELGSRS